MSPLKVLSRGYSMTQAENGQIIRSVHDVSSGNTIRITLQDGYLTATVTESKECGV